MIKVPLTQEIARLQFEIATHSGTRMKSSSTCDMLLKGEKDNVILKEGLLWNKEFVILVQKRVC